MPGKRENVQLMINADVENIIGNTRVITQKNYEPFLKNGDAQDEQRGHLQVYGLHPITAQLYHFINTDYS